ncbi:MAG: histidine kinase dimerization/phospho-acceptor domain-containing protein, partial [Nitrosopumilaceae archaeon]
MKIIQKAYFLLAIIIAAASVNLFLFVGTTQESTADSKAIITTNDLKVNAENIARLANTIARGDESSREVLVVRIDEFDTAFKTLKAGGKINDYVISAAPSQLKSKYDVISSSWQNYKKQAETIQVETVFDPEVRNALKYTLEKNGDLAILTDTLVQELTPLDRNFNRHKEIALELRELSKSIGEDTLLISIGEDAHAKLIDHRIRFDVNLKKLLQVPLDDSEIERTNIKQEQLAPLPRENTNALRKLDPLWESIRVRILVIEPNSVLSKTFGRALDELETERKTILDEIDDFVVAWTTIVDKKSSDRGLIVQGLLIADIGVFLSVLLSLRKSLTPLNTLVTALSRVKEGIYGEKINYHTNDEIGTLADSFNSMSLTIKEKEEEAKKIEISKDEFLAMITHELKTPLVPIQGYADILLRGHLGELNKNQKERLEIIKSSSASLLSLISDLLDAQKLDLGQLRIKIKQENLKSTAEKTIVAMSPQVQADQIELINGIKNDLYATYDDERIRQVLTNLIKNSLKTMSPKTGKIEILAEDLSNEVRVSLKDNGKGIPKDKQKDLFKKFYQMD